MYIPTTTEELSEYYPPMDVDQFDRFLAKQRLKQGLSRKPVKNGRQILIDKGWYAITSALITDLIDLGWNRHFISIRICNGHGHITIINGNPEIFARIKVWQLQTTKICEHCGSTEDVRTILEPPNPYKETCCFKCRENGDKFEKEIKAQLKRMK